MDGLRRFFSYSNEITPQEFDGYARPLLYRTQAYSWAPRVDAGQRADFERRASAWLGQAYQIRDQDAQGIWHPAPTRDYYYPVLYTQAASCKGSPTAWTCVDSPFARPPLFGLRHPAAWRSLRRWT